MKLVLCYCARCSGFIFFGCETSVVWNKQDDDDDDDDDDEQEEKHGQKAADATRVDMFAQIPPIEKMDQALASLVLCE